MEVIKLRRSIDAKPETKLMGTLFYTEFKDRDLLTEVDGKPLLGALWEIVNEVPDMVVSKRRKTPVKADAYPGARRA